MYSSWKITTEIVPQSLEIDPESIIVKFDSIARRIISIQEVSMTFNTLLLFFCSKWFSAKIIIRANSVPFTFWKNSIYFAPKIQKKFQNLKKEILCNKIKFRKLCGNLTKNLWLNF